VCEKRHKNQDGSVVTYLPALQQAGQLVENKRVAGKTRQRGLVHPGRADAPKLASDLGRVRATVLRGKGGQTFRLRDEIPAQAMPAFHAVGIRAPGRVERLD